jgi:hypothetical protein
MIVIMIIAKFYQFQFKVGKTQKNRKTEKNGF